MVELTTITMLVKTMKAFFPYTACQSTYIDDQGQKTCLRPVIWILTIVGLECDNYSVVVAGRD